VDKNKKTGLKESNMNEIIAMYSLSSYELQKEKKHFADFI